MKSKIGKIFQAMGNGLSAENADEMILTWRKSNILQIDNPEVPTANNADKAVEPCSHVRLYVVPSLLQQK